MDGGRYITGLSTATGTPRTASGTSKPIRLRIRTSGTLTTRSVPATYFFSSVLAEVFVMRPFRQPPIILPISSISCPSVVNCFGGISFNSQHSCIRNLSESIVDKDCPSRVIFDSTGENVAFCNISKRSVNRISTFCPSP